MTRDIAPDHIDVRAFADSAATLERQQPLQSFPRLAAEAVDPGHVIVTWRATGEMRASPGGAGVPWLELDASASLPLVCQRCLGTVEVPLRSKRWFRFVADEDTAALEDEAAEEDVLAESRDFDLRELTEDELLMEIPVSPRHEVCPEPVVLAVQDPEFTDGEHAAPNPFAVLGKLRRGDAE